MKQTFYQYEEIARITLLVASILLVFYYIHEINSNIDELNDRLLYLHGSLKQTDENVILLANKTYTITLIKIPPENLSLIPRYEMDTGKYW